MRFWFPLGLVILLLNVFYVEGQGSADAPSVRLAIIPLSPAMESLADLLTAEMSSKKELAMLERAQFQKILQEQTLSTTDQKADFIKLGQTLGASGLILMELVEGVSPSRE